MTPSFSFLQAKLAAPCHRHHRAVSSQSTRQVSSSQFLLDARILRQNDKYKLVTTMEIIPLVNVPTIISCFNSGLLRSHRAKSLRICPSLSNFAATRLREWNLFMNLKKNGMNEWMNESLFVFCVYWGKKKGREDEKVSNLVWYVESVIAQHST